MLTTINEMMINRKKKEEDNDGDSANCNRWLLERGATFNLLYILNHFTVVHFWPCGMRRTFSKGGC